MVQPWVYDRDAEIGEVLRIARDDGEAMLKSRSCNHAIRHTKGPAGGLTLAIEHAPAFGNGLRHGKNTIREPQRDRHLDEILQLSPSASWRKKRNAPAKLAKGHDAEKLGIFGMALEPRGDFGGRREAQRF